MSLSRALVRLIRGQPAEPHDLQAARATPPGRAGERFP